MAKNFFKMFNSNVNPFTEAKKLITPQRVNDIINSDEFDAKIDYTVKASKGKIEGHMCMYSPSIKVQKIKESYKINLNSKGIEIESNGTVIKIPMKLIWGFLSIITSILDVCEKITDLLKSFGIRLGSQLMEFNREFGQSVTVNDLKLSDICKSEIEKSRASHKRSSQTKWVSLTRHGIEYNIRVDANSDLDVILHSVLSEDGAEYGWYTVKVEGEKSFRFLHSSK